MIRACMDARQLQACIGQKLVAYACGLATPRLVGKWAEGIDEPTIHQAMQLKALGEVRDIVGFDALQPFLLGSNPNLGGDAPIDEIREGRFSEAIRAARTFVA